MINNCILKFVPYYPVCKKCGGSDEHICYTLGIYNNPLWEETQRRLIEEDLKRKDMENKVEVEE